MTPERWLKAPKPRDVIRDGRAFFQLPIVARRFYEQETDVRNGLLRAHAAVRILLNQMYDVVDLGSGKAASHVVK